MGMDCSVFEEWEMCVSGELNTLYRNGGVRHVCLWGVKDFNGLDCSVFEKIGMCVSGKLLSTGIYSSVF